MNTAAPALGVGCSIFKKELLFLTQKNNWPLETTFLPSGLHVNFARLRHSLDIALNAAGAHPLVLFGNCHPHMDQIVTAHNGIRIQVQNCLELLLGKDIFTRDLKQGAFFLLEDWAHHWQQIMDSAMGCSPAGQRQIMHECHRHILCLITPCSEDFSEEAQKISRQTELPIIWREVSLDHMESVLRDAMTQREAAL